MVKIKQQLVSSHIINKRSYGYGNRITGITVHQTGNTNPGANAKAHANIQSRLNPRAASWHVSVDDKEAYQSFPYNVMCWAATDGRGPGNTSTIHVELCINSDADYEKTLENGADVVKQLMNKHGISIKNVNQHNSWYPKDCPAQIRSSKAGISWDDFLAMIEGKKVTSKTTKKTRNYLQRGDRGSEVKDMQEMLIDLGYNLGGHGADGIFGEDTEKGLRQFQRDYDLTVDGLYGPASKSKLENTKPETKQNKSDCISQFQSWLNSYSFNSIAVDGLYGALSKKAAVKAYQRELNVQFGAGLTMDGIWGPKTRAASKAVSRGARGNITRIIQGVLYGLGYNPQGFDGIFGGGTELAVKAFQRDEGIGVDGKPGKNTFAKMFG
ncbi:peptidoglycan-binding protein [Virgibacillus sp. YIM 98842]|uniref:peptidoglycan recognition protein family protein n=1 Tax=Virgibacillus sp. YIM 98842 TaxID=2663533 RepID=UPI0013D92FA6|nr:peptidoglycan-binding protein [Virgibacillus sp. YIM 98842]